MTYICIIIIYCIQTKIKKIDRDYFLKICKRPNVLGAGGCCFYISNKSCNILVKHMENINWNIFVKIEVTDTYPYTIEDVAISFILYFSFYKLYL